jgi:hypothetical protein
MLPRRPRLLRRVQLARRLASGLDPGRAARAARCPEELLEQLLGEPEFLEIVQGWRALLELDPPARTARLVKLAQLVLEEALERRSLPAALFTLVQAFRGKDPVQAVADGLARALARARAEAERAAAAPPSDALPAQAPPAPPPAAVSARRRPDPLTGLCRRTGASLRAAMVVEQGRWAAAAPQAPASATDPLGAAVHALHRMADAAAASRSPAPPPPAARTPDPARAAQVDALTGQLMQKLAQAGPAQRLALERLDDAALDRLARQLLTTPPRAGPAQPRGP